MSLDLLPGPLPFLTKDLPGTGGIAKVNAEDFIVEEIPAYLPAGTGEHLYLWIEKRNLSTQEAGRLIAKALGVSDRDVGYAGQKDRRAVTRQWLSVHTSQEAPEVDDSRLRIMKASRHGNKLRLGHSRGNRFAITLRGTTAGAIDRAQKVLARLAREGLPNFYGTQRFGRRGDNAVLGAALLGLGSHPDLGQAKRDRFLRRLAISALQSELFNRCLIARIADGLWNEVLHGDVLRKRGSGGVFVCTAPEEDRPRLHQGEIDVTGPMPGDRERPAAEGEARAREDAVLTGAGVPREAFQRARGEAEGARRPFRVPVTDGVARAIKDDTLELSFALPAGSYATRVIAEVAKSAIDLPGEE